MEQNQNDYITLEMAFKLRMRDYRLILGVKRTWIVAVVVGVIQLFVWLVKKS